MGKAVGQRLYKLDAFKDITLRLGCLTDGACW